MLKFAGQLTSREVEKFVTSYGFCVHELTMNRTSVETVKGTFRVASYYFDFLFDDNVFILKNIHYNSSVIKEFDANEADISFEDWRCFMRERFGEEYVNAYFKEDVSYNVDEVHSDEFLSKITIEDICNLLGDRVASVSCIKEVESFGQNKRRFKFYTGSEIREVIFASFYDNSTIKRYISEEKFLKFMYEKFGDEFAKYYLAIISSIEKNIFNVSDESQQCSSSFWLYKENREALSCKKYLAGKIFGK